MASSEQLLDPKDMEQVPLNDDDDGAGGSSPSGSHSIPIPTEEKSEKQEGEEFEQPPPKSKSTSPDATSTTSDQETPPPPPPTTTTAAVPKENPLFEYCDAGPLNGACFVTGAIMLIIRVLLYKFPDLLAEVILVAISMMLCSLLTCKVRRGHFAREFEFLPSRQRVPRKQSPLSSTPSIAEEVSVAAQSSDTYSGPQIQSKVTCEASVHQVESTSSPEASTSGQTPDSGLTGTNIPSASSASEDSPVDSAERKKKEEEAAALKQKETAVSI